MNATRRFVRFVVLGFYSPSGVLALSEPMPAATLPARWRQWRGRRGWPEGMRADAAEWAAAHPMTFEDFMATCNRMSAAAFGGYEG